MNKKIMTFCSISLTALLACVIVANEKPSLFSFSALGQECSHVGNHYASHEATNETTGNDEYWICCKCNESFTTKPKVGTWTNFDNFDSSVGGLRDEHKTFLPKCLFAGESINMASGYTYEVVSGGATISENKIKLTKPGEVSIKVSKGDFEKTFTKTIIDFGNVTGEATDLATVLDAWGYGDKGYGNVVDGNVTITRANSITDVYKGGTQTMNALNYSRPSNNGTNRDRTNNMLFIRPEIVTKAVSAGYTYISFYAFVPRVNDSLDSTYLGLFNSTSVGGLDGTNNSIGTAGNNGDTWRYQSITLASLKTDHGIGFAINSKHLYLTNVKFLGADISSVAKNYIKASKENGKSYDLVDNNLIGKMFTTTSNCETLTRVATGSSSETTNGGGDYYNLVRTNNIQTTNNTPFNGVIISADWLKYAKSQGYNSLHIYFKVTGTAGDTTANANIYRMRVNGQTSFAMIPSNETMNNWLRFTISGVTDGESIFIGFTGERLTLAGITFRTDNTNNPAGSYGWASANVINTGNLCLINS